MMPVIKTKTCPHCNVEMVVTEKHDCKIKSLQAENESLKEDLKEVKVTMNHARVFITSRQKMHPTGVGLWDEQVEEINKLLKGSE